MSLAHEQSTVRAMIELFCRKQHGTEGLCASCSELLEYAEKRVAGCPFKDDKPQCRNCPIHCYSPEMRRRISQVMRFSGPRLMFVHPILAIRHMLNRRKPDGPPARGPTDQPLV